MNVRTWWTVGALAVLLPCKAAGQICSGFAAFTEGRFQASGSGAFNDDAKSFGGGFAFGTEWSFGQVSLGTTSYDDLDGSSFNAGASAGFQFKLDSKGKAQWCPTVGFAFASGPNDVDVFGDSTFILDLVEEDFSFGISAGVVTSESDQTRLVPTVSLSFVSATLKAEDQVSGDSDSVHDSFGVWDWGLGSSSIASSPFVPGRAFPSVWTGPPQRSGRPSASISAALHSERPL